MPRKPRIEYPGAISHVVAVGNQHRYVFLADEDYRSYLDNLRYYYAKLDFKLYAYTLMQDHVHLLIEQGEIPLSKVMQRIQQRFTQHYNRHHNKSGHLFQGRYYAKLCARDEYFQQILRYVHLNPWKKELVKDPLDYKWSSHSVYWRGEKSAWLDVAGGLEQFHRTRRGAVNAYRRFILDGIADPERIIPDVVDVADEPLRTASSERDETVSACERQPRIARQLKEVVAEFCAERKVSLALLQGRSKQRNLSTARKDLIVKIASETASDQIEVAKVLNRDPSYVSRTIENHLRNSCDS